MKYQFFPKVPTYQIAGCPIHQPKEVLLMLTKTGYVPEQEILLLGLKSLNISYREMWYSRTELAYGPLPNLVLRNRCFNQADIVKALNDIFYTSEDVLWNERQKAFTRDVSERFSRLLNYYSNYTRTFGGVHHLTNQDMRKQCIELFEMLKRCLIDGTFNFEDDPKHQPKVSFPDIVVYCYLEAITRNIPESTADELIRSYYSPLLEWKINIERIMLQLSQEPIFPQRSKPITLDLQVTVQPEPDRPLFRLNWQRSLVSLSLIGLLYGMFA